jgi:hypothetical protein
MKNPRDRILECEHRLAEVIGQVVRLHKRVSFPMPPSPVHH